MTGCDLVPLVSVVPHTDEQCEGKTASPTPDNDVASKSFWACEAAAILRARQQTKLDADHTTVPQLWALLCSHPAFVSKKGKAFREEVRALWKNFVWLHRLDPSRDVEHCDSLELGRFRNFRWMALQRLFGAYHHSLLQAARSFSPSPSSTSAEGNEQRVSSAPLFFDWLAAGGLGSSDEFGVLLLDTESRDKAVERLSVWWGQMDVQCCVQCLQQKSISSSSCSTTEIDSYVHRPYPCQCALPVVLARQVSQQMGIDASNVVQQPYDVDYGLAIQQPSEMEHWPEDRPDELGWTASEASPTYYGYSPGYGHYDYPTYDSASPTTYAQAPWSSWDSEQGPRWSGGVPQAADPVSEVHPPSHPTNPVDDTADSIGDEREECEQDEDQERQPFGPGGGGGKNHGHFTNVNRECWDEQQQQQQQQQPVAQQPSSSASTAESTLAKRLAILIQHLRSNGGWCFFSQISNDTTKKMTIFPEEPDLKRGDFKRWAETQPELGLGADRSAPVSASGKKDWRVWLNDQTPQSPDRQYPQHYHQRPSANHHHRSPPHPRFSRHFY